MEIQIDANALKESLKNKLYGCEVGWCMGFWSMNDDDDFCPCGERRDDELQEDDGRSQVPCAE